MINKHAITHLILLLKHLNPWSPHVFPLMHKALGQNLMLITGISIGKDCNSMVEWYLRYIYTFVTVKSLC